MFKEKHLINPVNDFIWALPLDSCSDKDLDWMIKNLLANFQKLYGCTTNIAQIQNDYLKNKNNGSLDIITFNTNSIEYFHLKINTIFEINYQIYLKLCTQNKPQKQSKYEYLEEKFLDYNRETKSDLNIDWFSQINTVRNRIAHGGFSIKSFASDGYLTFQAYDRELDEQICEDFGFFVNGRPIIYADLYTNFYTEKAHQYIHQFLAFVIHSLSESGSKRSPFGIVEQHSKESASILQYGGEDVFLSTSHQLGRR